ncbi:MAG: hypothetical protein ACLQVY_12140 [Limisphaerales bacterium]
MNTDANAVSCWEFWMFDNGPGLAAGDAAELIEFLGFRPAGAPIAGSRGGGPGRGTDGRPLRTEGQSDSAQDRRAGYRYDLSVLQAEFSLTQVWDRAVHGRCFFEEVIRENIDWGRPEQVQLIFARKMQRKTATDGRCRTRLITEGVGPSLHVSTASMPPLCPSGRSGCRPC